MISDNQLEEWQKICVGIAKGPWNKCHHLESEEKDNSCPCGFPGDIWGGDKEHIVCSIGPHCVQGSDMLPRYPRKIELKNAGFISVARTAMPKLIKEVKRLRKELTVQQSQSMRIGQFTLSPCTHDGLWLEKEGGEGMQILNSLPNLEQMFAEFWERNF